MINVIKYCSLYWFWNDFDVRNTLGLALLDVDDFIQFCQQFYFKYKFLKSFQKHIWLAVCVVCMRRDKLTSTDPIVTSAQINDSILQRQHPLWPTADHKASYAVLLELITPDHPG